jgi:adenylate kinase family enzyme
VTRGQQDAAIQGEPTRIVVLSGPVGAGKSTLGKALAGNYDAVYVRTQDLLRDHAEDHGIDLPAERRALQDYGDQLDTDTNGAWVTQAVSATVARLETPAQLLIIDSVRRLNQIEALRDAFPRVDHIHVFASETVLDERYQKRGDSSGLAELGSYAEVAVNRTESEVSTLADDADAAINTEHCDRADVEIRAAAALRLLPSRDERLVDVLVGGQYGSEGKGNIAYYLAGDYDLLIRVGGPNAGHKVVTGIGSTGKGGGAAAARRIMGRHHADPPVRLARDMLELAAYIRPAAEVLGEAYRRRQRIMLEGTQGTGLSPYHGAYPHVTSRDTTTAGCLAEAGVAWSRVRRVIMVCRTYPIRVMSPAESTSGPMKQDLEWEAIAERSGIPVAELLATERGSVSHKQRRVAEFDWELLRSAAELNGATEIALTFADYLDVKNRQARRYDQLQPETILFIEEIERVSGAPVTLIGTRFDERSVIDRRH